MVAEISWTKHNIILTKCKDSQERRFYILATKCLGWTKNVLLHQIESKAFENYLLGQQLARCHHDSWFQHLTYHTHMGANASNEWLEPVTDEVYNELK